MNSDEVRRYANDLGCTTVVNTYDGGFALTISPPLGSGYPSFFEQADYPDVERLMVRAVRYLNGLPWPTPDDPRVATTEGVTL